jgi:Lrp/AsnC family leucine-responsive transcriptional regulator
MAKTLNETHELDAKDRQILGLVQRDGKLPQAEVAKQVGLSTGAVHERLRKLERAGVIRGYGAIVDPRAVGATVAAFIEVFIEHPRHEQGFIGHVRGLDEVQECHHITGEFSLMLKVRVADMQRLQDLLVREINGLPGVRQTRTVIVLSTSKEDGFVPTGVRGATT